MSVPTVASTSPIDSAVNVSTDIKLEITFDVPINRSTVTSSSLLLYETNTNVTIPGNITFSIDDLTAFFFPTRELQQSNSYTFVAVGAADNLPFNVESATGDALAVSYTVNFRTGSERFVSLDEVTDRTDIEHVAPIREEDVLAETTGTLSVLTADPEGFSTCNDNPDTITITFDEILASSSFNADWMTVEMRPILDYGDYYYGGVVDGVNKLRIQDENVNTIIPSGNIYVDGATLYWEKGVGAVDWPFNAEIVVTLAADIEGTSGNTLGSDITVLFTTTMFPLFVGSNYIRLEIGPAVKELFNDTINRTALKRSIESWELTRRSFDLDTPPYAAREYAKCGAILDILDSLTLKADMNSGVAKRLGDWMIDYGRRGGIKDTGKYLPARKCFEKNEQKLSRWSPSIRMRVAALGIDSGEGPTYFQGFRNWDNLYTTDSVTLPAANWAHQRCIQKAFDNNLRSSTVLFYPGNFLIVRQVT